jgi:hypothetical protein
VPQRADQFLNASITIVMVVLAFLALDDITTDHDTNFVVERTMVIVADAWFVLVAWRVLRLGHRGLGGLSIAVAIAAAVAQWMVGPGTAPFRAEYLLTVLGLAWFAMLAGTLAWIGWREAHTPATRVSR